MRIATIFLLSAIITNFALANNTLSFDVDRYNGLSVQLKNTDAVSGLQFVITTSSHFSIKAISKSNRTEPGYWQIHYNIINETTVSVVILASTITHFKSGSGSIVKIDYEFTEGYPSSNGYISLREVVIADPSAQRLRVNVIDFEWTQGSHLEHLLFASSLNGNGDADLAAFTLDQNFPNPFNPTTTIRYILTEPSQVSLKIYDMSGRLVQSLIDEVQHAGMHAADWNGSNGSGHAVASGMYIYTLTVNGKAESRRMVLMK